MATHHPLLSSRTHLVAFNTGRHYSTHGQRIVAWVEKAESGQPDRVCFVDFDRQINGSFPFCWSVQSVTPADFARHVLHMYDWGQYQFGIAEGVHARLQAVFDVGYEAFIADPEVRVIGRLT
jgi:hypothetical protein